MDTSRPCGCKGCRTCLICESEYGISKNEDLVKDFGTYVYCPYCDKAWPGWDVNDYKKHPDHSGTSIEYPGVFIRLDFLTESEEQDLMKGIENTPWDLSQSGRRKQNFGPKCNFKKRKLKPGDFNGFPKFSEFTQDKFKSVGLLNGFQTIEQCTLEYDPKRGASIDAHIDDCWIWGERIVTVNLLSGAMLTMTYNSKPQSYNLNDVGKYKSVVLDSQPFYVKHDAETNHPVVRIPMPKRSLLIIYGAARYEWEHRVLREDIPERRLCLAYREFTPPYLENGEKYEESKPVLEKACNFF